MIGLKAIFGGNVSVTVGALLLYGGLLVIAACALSVLWDWAKHRLPLPRWLPQRVREALAWNIYRPIVGPVRQLQTAGLSVFLTLAVEAIFPYGPTMICFDTALLRVRQDGRWLYFLPKRKNNTFMRIGRPEEHGMMIDFDFEYGPTEGTPPFDAARAFSWKLTGVTGILISNRNVAAVGQIPPLKGVKRGLQT